jgi:ABC-type multidrug transport system ATPase subunit
MNIRLENISKRYGNTWVFRGITCDFIAGLSYAVTGPNGSGKSTLMKIISGGLVPSGGRLTFSGDSGGEMHWADCATEITFAAPYIDLIERLTLEEHLDFHFQFRDHSPGMDKQAILGKIDMADHRGKQVRDFSSGMKQRLKLALSFYTDAKIMLLDEPTSNLDERWTEWYRKEIREAQGRLIIIASNDKREYEHCREEVRLGS